MDYKSSILLLLTIIYLVVAAHPRKTRICQRLYLYVNATGKCYEQYEAGPCGELATVVPHEKDDGEAGLGKCECSLPICTFDRPRIFKGSGCYYIYDKGPCAEGEWLVPSSNQNADCMKIPCVDEYKKQAVPAKMDKARDSKDKSFLFPFEGKCYRTLQEGFPSCPQGNRVYMDAQAKHFHFLCSSDPEEECDFFQVGVLVNTPKQCANGSLADRYGGCNPVGNF